MTPAAVNAQVLSAVPQLSIIAQTPADRHTNQWCSTRVRQCTWVRLEYLFWGLGLEPTGLGLSGLNYITDTNSFHKRRHHTVEPVGCIIISLHESTVKLSSSSSWRKAFSRSLTDARARRLRSADTRTLAVGRTQSTFSDRTFTAAASRLWNSLPPDLRQPGLSYGQFRRALKTFLFGQ